MLVTLLQITMTMRFDPDFVGCVRKDASCRRRKFKLSVVSLVVHAVLLSALIFAGMHSVKHSVASEKAITAFITQGAAPPPPPPPPPAAKASATPQTPRVQPQQTPVQRNVLIPPTEIKQLPKVEDVPIQTTESLPSSDTLAGVAGGVEGGVVGGVVGGETGGEAGGIVGGQIGGTGTGTEGTGTGGIEAPVVEAPPPPPPPPPPPAPEPVPEPTAPLRVGGDVKAPVVTDRAEPVYTTTARKARVSGVVVVEAVIGKNGRAEEVRVLKGLPMGLSEAAVEAVKKWRFQPGTLNGKPIATIFSLTVTFKLE